MSLLYLINFSLKYLNINKEISLEFMLVSNFSQLDNLYKDSEKEFTQISPIFL